ncbi:MAG: hypothetical protein GF311_23105 [Candidatus Lokiarchaeota archaeon]|nr:hypothetical protein [Candidatus Lokiarchaeota archaeon]
MKVLVLDADERSSLAIVRSLGKRGINVTCLGSSPFSLASLSKYTSQAFVSPSIVESNVSEFLVHLCYYLRKYHFDLVIPTSDETSTILSKYKGSLENYSKIAIETWNKYVLTYDKANTWELCRSLSIPIPRTFLPSKTNSIQEISEIIQYPALIKPRSKSIFHDNSLKILKVTSDNYVESKDELLEKFANFLAQNSFLSELDYLPLIQEKVTGIGVGCEVLCKDGKIVAFFQHIRVRSYPRSGGASTVRESINEPLLLEYSKKIISELGWTGVAMLEFIKIEDEFFLIEINGRYWGSLPLAISSGVDFPYLHIQQTLGEPVTQPPYLKGLKQRWTLPGDILWLFESLRNGLLGSITKFIKGFVYRDDIYSIRDFKPTIGAIIKIGKLFVDVILGRRTLFGEKQ